MNKLLVSFVFFSLVILPSCGFKVLEKSQLLNYHIKEFETSGNKKINYHIKNNIKNVIKSKDAQESILIKIKSDHNKSIKEKNDKNQITKYQINLTVNAEINFLEKRIKKNINQSINGDYNVEDNHQSTLNNQNTLELYLAKKASRNIINQLVLVINDL